MLMRHWPDFRRMVHERVRCLLQRTSKGGTLMKHTFRTLSVLMIGLILGTGCATKALVHHAIGERYPDELMASVEGEDPVPRIRNRWWELAAVPVTAAFDGACYFSCVFADSYIMSMAARSGAYIDNPGITAGYLDAVKHSAPLYWRDPLVVRAPAELLPLCARMSPVQDQAVPAAPLHARSIMTDELALNWNLQLAPRDLHAVAKESGNEFNIEQVEQLYRRALVMDERELCRTHPNVIDDLNGLALHHCDQGRYAQAEAIYKRVLDITSKALEPNDPFIAKSMNNLASLDRAKKRGKEAEASEHRAEITWATSTHQANNEAKDDILFSSYDFNFSSKRVAAF
jgi:hypothetical protein